MVGASALSPSDTVGQEALVGSTQSVVTAVQHCLEYFGFQHPDLELEGGARLVVQFEGILPETAPRVAYAPVDLDGQVGVVVDVPPEVIYFIKSRRKAREEVSDPAVHFLWPSL